MKALILLLTLCAALALAACGDDDSTTDATGAANTTAEGSDSDSGTTDGSDSGASAEDSSSGSQPGTAPGKTEPAVGVPAGPPPTKLVVKDIEEGDGEEVKDGDKISVAYVGVNIKTGKEFESTWGGKAPSEFKMDSGELIKGWERGIEGMKVGGRRELIVPADLAYGRDPLVYVVDLVGIE